jgi:hypothetical protein
MATKYWVGSDGDLDVAANWYPVGVPVAADVVIFDGRAVGSISSNLDVWETVDLGGLKTRIGYTGNLSSSGSAPLIMSTTSGEVYLSGTGSVFLQCGGGAEADAVISECIVNTSGNVFLSSQANDNANSAVYTEVRVIKGTVNILGDSEKAGGSGHGGDSGAAITTLKVTPSGTATVRVGDKCVNFKGTDAPMNVIIDGGTLNFHSAAGDIQQMAGALNYGSSTINMGTADDDITALTLSGGTFNWVPQNSGSISATPTITDLKVISGTFSATSMKNTLPGGADPVVTTTWQYAGTVDLKNVYANFDFTTYYDEGGSLLTSPGQELSLEGGS